jgi:hypothetical protein
MPAEVLGFNDSRGASRSHEQGRIARELDLGVAFQPARMIPEIPQAILSAALRITPAGRATLVRFYLEADLRAGRQNQHFAGLVAARMADECPFAGCAGRRPKHPIPDAVVGSHLLLSPLG